MTAVAVIKLYSKWNKYSDMAIKGSHCHRELFSLCPVKQQIRFSTYNVCSPVISTVGDMRERRWVPYTSEMNDTIGEIKNL